MITKVLIVEDEMPSARKLKTFLSIIAPDFTVLDILDTIADTVEFLQENTVDLIFLDIHLADGNSFDIFEQIDIDIPIIFTTAYNKYAIDAFKQMSIDYLLKPLEKERLKLAVDKYLKIRNRHLKNNYYTDYKNINKLITQISNQKEYKQRFMIHFRNKMKSIATSDIAAFYSESKSVFLMTYAGTTYDVPYSLEQLEQVLNPEEFFRANRQCIVSINTVEEAIAYSHNKLLLKTLPALPIEIIISSKKTSKFKKWLG